MEWKVLEECNEYEINEIGEVRRIANGHILKRQSSSIILRSTKYMVVINTAATINKYFPNRISQSSINLEGEIWKDVKGFENYYQVSSKGRVKTVPHIRIRRNGRPHTVNEKILSMRVRGKKRKPYYNVRLYNETRDINASVHVLVCEAFHENKFNLPVVNHKDGNQLNNNEWNVEWSTVEYNVFHADRITKSFDKLKKKVLICNLNGDTIRMAGSIKEAAKIVKGHRTCIRNVCIGKQELHKGYKFFFAS